MLLLALLPLMIGPVRASAQAVYYRGIPIGERAIGLGGAYTGIAEDPSAAYYNPAGITTGGRFQLLGSLSSLVLTRSKIVNGFRFDGDSESLSSNSSTTLPRFVGTVAQFGRVKYGSHQFALAYNTLELQRNALSFTETKVTESSSVDVRLQNGFRSRWYGVSFAGRLSEKMSLGTTAYLAVQRQTDDENIGLAQGGTLVDGVRLGGESITAATEVSAKSYHLALRFGYLYRINPRWSWGLMFQAPGIPLRQRGSFYQRVDDNASDPSSYILVNESGLEAHIPIPFELRTGARYRINEATLISSDFSVDGPIRDRSFLAGLDSFDETGLGRAVYYGNSTERRWAPNAAVGVEHRFGNTVVAGGIFTNISAAPGVPQTSQVYTPAQINTYGASIYVGLDTNGYNLSFGATGLWGRGDALSVTIDSFGEPLEYERTRASSSALMLFVAGAVSVASKAAKDIKEWHEEKTGSQNRQFGAGPSDSLAGLAPELESR